LLLGPLQLRKSQMVLSSLRKLLTVPLRPPN
jgi:hypothetical protein